MPVKILDETEAAALQEQDDDDVYYDIGERLKLEGETERWAFVRGSGKACQRWYSWPLPAQSHWEVEVGGTSCQASAEKLWGKGGVYSTTARNGNRVNGNQS